MWRKCVCETDRLTDRENRLVVAGGTGVREVWSGRLGSAPVNVYAQNG